MKGDAVHIEQLREFAHLSKTMSFTKSAQALNLAQSALSTHVIKMEKELGIQLLDRTRQQISFTPAGRDFLETISVMLEAYDRFLNRCCGKVDGLSGHFSVLSLQHVDMATFVLLKRIQGFRVGHPDVLVDIHESLEYNTVELIKKRVVDCGYFGLHLEEPETEDGIEAVPLIREEFVVWVDRQSSFAKKGGLRPDDLRDATIPVWAGISNDLETVYREFFSYFSVNVHFSDRYCTSREDFFLSRVRPDDVVLLTRGSENINAIKVRDDRIAVRFDPPIFATSYIAFDEKGTDDGLLSFKRYLFNHGDEANDSLMDEHL